MLKDNQKESVTIPVGMVEGQAMVEAEVAEDHREELEAARQDGRLEALEEAYGDGEPVVANAKKEETVAELEKKRQRKLFFFFVVFAVVHVIGGAIAAIFILTDDSSTED